jgi:hypothetical protein
MRVVLVSLLLVSMLSSCKKYRLNGDKEILVGDWEWVSTEVEYLSSSGGSYTATPALEDFTASVSFAKRNKIVFSRDGVEEDSGRIKIVAFEDESGSPLYSWSGAFTFRKDAERKKYNFWLVKDNDDELHLRGFPYTSSSGTQVWYNVFRRK